MIAVLSRTPMLAVSASSWAACPNYGARFVAKGKTLGAGRGAYDTVGLVEPKPPKPKYGRGKRCIRYHRCGQAKATEAQVKHGGKTHTYIWGSGPEQRKSK